MARHTRTKKTYIQFITQYGIHIWAILLIANAVMVYAYEFSTHAAGKSDLPIQALDVSVTPATSPSPSEAVTPSEAPTQTQLLGPGLSLDFTVPGIGSGGGVMKPNHLKRNVTVYLYSQDVNSMNPAVKPLYTIQTIATFDTNQYNPTYTTFLNPEIDFGSDVKDGNYQIAFRTDQSLRTILKQNPTDLGGEIFALNKGQTIQIPVQTVLMGDTIPTSGGNNTIDINDYNAFVTCYGKTNNTNSFCKTGNFGDFNDDGIIDGIDYNILLRSLYVLSQEGLAVPQLTPSPAIPTIAVKHTQKVTPTITQKKNGPTPKTSKGSAKTSASAGSAIGGILFFLFIIIVGVIAFIFRGKILSLIHMSPTGTPSDGTTETSDETGQTEEPTEQSEADAQEAAPEQPVEETQRETSEQTEEQNENQISPELSDKMPPDPAEETPQPQPEPSKAGDTLEKDCYIKTKGKDEAGTGMWLLLTDDNGALNAHYAKSDVKDGFAKVKGVMKEEDGKKFLEVSELTMEG